MFIKSFLICMFIPSIIIDANDSSNTMGNPILENVTRGGKFFGLFSVPKKSIFPSFASKNKNWRGGLVVSFGGYPLIVTSVEYNHFHTRDPYCFFCLQHPQQINTLVNQLAQQPQEVYGANDGITNVNSHISAAQAQHDPLDDSMELPLNTTSILASAIASLSAIPNATTMKAREALRTIKLEDYDVITLDPTSDDDDDGDASRKEEVDESAVSRVRREFQNLRQESNVDIESTTVESSMQQMPMVTTTSRDDLGGNEPTSVSSSLELPQNPSQDFQSTTMTTAVTATTEITQHPSYPSSKYPNAQYISITKQPQSGYEYLPQIPAPMKNYYNFYPSQPDYSRYNNYIPYCYANMPQNRFTPSSYFNDGSMNLPLHLQHNYFRKR